MSQGNAAHVFLPHLINHQFRGPRLLNNLPSIWIRRNMCGIGMSLPSDQKMNFITNTIFMCVFNYGKEASQNVSFSFYSLQLVPPTAILWITTDYFSSPPAIEWHFAFCLYKFTRTKDSSQFEMVSFVFYFFESQSYHSSGGLEG